MRFRCMRTDMSNAVSNVSRAVSAKATIPALEGVLINLKNNTITVTGYDLEMGIKCMTEPAESIEDGEIVVNAKIFGEMIKKMGIKADAILYSPLSRAKDTAAHISEICSIPMREATMLLSISTRAPSKA